MNPSDDLFMSRAVYLASLGLGSVEPNPMVGAVLVHDGRVIGEGYHKKFGEAHAEVNAIHDAIKHGFGDLLSDSKLFVTLEPCSHYGKTPPCTDLILKHKIPEVVIGNSDPFPIVNGTGIDRLKNAGVEVKVGFMETACSWMNRRFLTAQHLRRPYVTLKFAQTADRFMAPLSGEPVRISSPLTDRLVHKWRSEEQAILVGTSTARMDNPRLNVRLWKGRQPVRVVLDKNLALPQELNLFDQSQSTIVFNDRIEKTVGCISYHRLNFNNQLFPNLVKKLFDLGLHSLLVEGGAKVLEQFISAGLWDEARIITSRKTFGAGLPSPILRGTVFHRISHAEDQILFLRPL